VTNIGGNPANDVIVEFWNGERGTGTHIANRTITVGINQTITPNVTWIIPEGYHTISAYIDPLNLIGELNETNNNATQNISVLRVNITLPPNATVTADTTPGINFSMQDYTTGTLNYTIYVDGSYNGQTALVTDPANVTINLSTLAEGARDIVVRARDALGRIKDSEPVTIIVDLTAPNPQFETQNNTFFSITTPNIFFNITDAVDNVLNWTLYIDGGDDYNGTVVSGVSSNQTIGPLTNGSYVLILQAYDDVGNVANSTPITIFVDQVPPVPSIETANETWFNTGTPGIDFNITDNLDVSLNYTFYVDDNDNLNGTVANGTSSTANLVGLTNGTFVVRLEGTDSANNAANSTPITIYVDTVPPNVTLLFPANDTNLTSTTTTLNFTVIDNMDTVLQCNLTLDSSIIRSNITVNN
ncbi:MAG: hypothetical protein MI867_18200, partial [Pseudomonadales bacterium]|nr:hypothetical protein [Pseudomonadales bacterium]